MAALVTLALTGCANAPTPTTGASHETAMPHVHNIVANPTGDGFLLGTHDGVFTATAAGSTGSRLGPAFDAMGLTVLGDDLLASGHPAASSPEGWGSPNLGVMRSADGGESWDPIAFVGDKDFHALATAPSGEIYGVTTDGGDLLVSADRGSTWATTGATPRAFALAVDATERVIATTPEGVRQSTDAGVTFTMTPDAPALYVVSSSPDAELLVGVDTSERIWISSAGGEAWTAVGTGHGVVGAIAITDGGDVLVADDSGLTLLPADR